MGGKPMKIYTKTGDKGETGLFDGTRVPKDATRVDAYGAVDELNAVLGAALAFLGDAGIAETLREVQRDLFAVGARLADPRLGREGKSEKDRFESDRVVRLEQIIDRFEAELPPLRRFILPGGSPAGAFLHLARTVCRRAERRIVTLARETEISPVVITYMNRLSDLLFVLARAANHRAGAEEMPW
jgi:cob(I)alamin adenosyltransferase